MDAFARAAATPGPLMLALRRFRHAVTRAVLTEIAPPPDPQLANTVAVFVDERIESMPSHLRAGIFAVEAMLLVTTSVGGRVDSIRRMKRWEGSVLPPVAQYARLIRSLVLLAAYEGGPQDEGLVA